MSRLFRRLARRLVFKLLWLAVSLGSWGYAHRAHAEGVDLNSFGLDDVAKAAHCVSEHMPSSLSSDTAQGYWGPALLVQGQCVRLDDLEENFSRDRARGAFLSALSQCTGQRQADDTLPWARRVAYGAAVIAAHGVFNYDSGASLLSQLLGRTAACPPPKVLDGAPGG